MNWEGACRLVTIQDNGIHVLCNAGKHADADRWLNKNRGLSLTLNEKNQLIEVFCSEDIKVEDKRINTEPYVRPSCCGARYQ